MDLQLLRQLDTQRASDPDIISQVSDYILGIDVASEAGEAQSAMKELIRIADSFAGLSDQKNFEIYSSLAVVCKANTLWISPEDEAYKFMSDMVLSYLQADPNVDLPEKVGYFVNAYNANKQEKEKRLKTLLDKIRGNNQTLQSGKNELTVRSVLQEYDQYTNRKKNRSTTDRAQFLSQSKSAQTLDSENRGALVKLLEIYDWMGQVLLNVPEDNIESGVQINTSRQAPSRNVDFQPRRKLPPPVPKEESAPSPEHVENLRKVNDEAFYSDTKSLSRSIADAGGEDSEESGMRKGQSDQQMESVTTKKEESTQNAPAKGMLAPGVVDLKRKVPMEISQISGPGELSKIDLNDLGSDFEAGIEKVKSKIAALAQEKNLPAQVLLNHFAQSPLYKLYTSMGVAVMNDNSGDQKAAFEKVRSNYEAAGKPFLTREQFLAVHKLKKELASAN